MRTHHRPLEGPVFITLNPSKSRSRQVAADLLRYFRGRGIRALGDPDTARFLGPDADGLEVASSPADCDLIVILGGDGTFLSVARRYAELGIPFLAVNLGTLGFLAQVAPESAGKALVALFETGAYDLEFRPILDAALFRNHCLAERLTAVNDFSLVRDSPGRLNMIDVFIAGHFVNTYLGDGVVIATPTGSTAYSLSGGGPILAPDVHGFLITPIACHTLSSRALVIPGSEIVHAVNRSNHPYTTILVDGQVSFRMLPGDVAAFTTFRHRIRMIRFPEVNFYETLRTKLDWGENGPRHAP